MIFPVLWAEKGLPKKHLSHCRTETEIFTGPFRDLKHHGAADAQIFTIYENFSGEKRVGTSRA